MRILIVKMSSLGDIIQALPVLDYFKGCVPHAEIDWVVEQPFAELLQAHPLVHKTIAAHTKKWRSSCFSRLAWKEIAGFYRLLRSVKYDLVLDLQGNSKSGLVTHRAKSALKAGFGFSTAPEWPNLLATNKKIDPPIGQNIRSDYLYLAQMSMDGIAFKSSTPPSVLLKLSEKEKVQLLPIYEGLKAKRGMKIMVCPGSNWTNKQLTVQTLRNFLECLSRSFDAHFLFIWGSPSEKETANQMSNAFLKNSDVVDRLSLPALQNLMANVDLVITMDSLPLHLAGTTNTPTYSFFGASSADKYKPLGKQSGTYQGICPYDRQFEKRCPILRTCKTGACIKNLEGGQLFDSFIAWWNS